MKAILIGLACLGLGGCIHIGDSREPIAVEKFAAPAASPERPLVVVLPGFGVNAKEMTDRGVARMIQEAWPEADVVLTSATWAYYRDGKLVPRLHEEVVAPARRAGYRRIWLAGASMGGMGALLYERAHPGETAGLILFAPFLGERELLREIEAAGGVRAWAPGPLAAEVNGDNYQREVWKMVKGWTERPQGAPRVWLACGDEDPLVAGARLLASVLPQDRYFELLGSHTWSTWLTGGRTVFARVRSDS